MNPTKQRNLKNVIKNADKKRRQMVIMKSHATIKFKKGKITGEERDLIHNRSNGLQEDIKDYIAHYQSKLKTMEGSGRKQRGRGAYF